MTTYDERGGYPHPDHIKCHEISVAAFEAAADPERYPELGEPWQVLKLYYHHSFNKARIQAIHDAMIAHGLESPWAERLKEWKDEPEWDARVTTRVPCSDYFGVRDQALLAHATQIDPDGFWFAIPRELQTEVWPTEDFELVTSHVTSRAPRGRPLRRHHRPALRDWAHAGADRPSPGALRSSTRCPRPTTSRPAGSRSRSSSG